MRAEVIAARRLVVKVGSSSLTGDQGHLDPERVKALASDIAALHNQGRRVALVTSGAIASALSPLSLNSRPRDLETQQAAAAVGQGILIRHYTEAFASHGLLVAQILLTAGDLQDGRSYRNALNTVSRLFRLGVVPVINENDTVATGEIRFGDNDRLAALTAHLIRADVLAIFSDVDGLYTAHPAEPQARLIRRVHDLSALSIDTSAVGSRVGTGGMRTKVEAARIATSGGVTVLLAHFDQLAAGLRGEEAGTLFEAAGRRRPRRLLWLAHAADVCGALRIDSGAVRAIMDGHASLLAAGVDSIEGDFEAGDPLDITGPDHRLVARGLADCSTAELRKRMRDGGLAVHRDLLRPAGFCRQALLYSIHGFPVSSDGCPLCQPAAGHPDPRYEGRCAACHGRFPGSGRGATAGGQRGRCVGCTRGWHPRGCDRPAAPRRGQDRCDGAGATGCGLTSRSGG